LIPKLTLREPAICRFNEQIKLLQKGILDHLLVLFPSLPPLWFQMSIMLVMALVIGGIFFRRPDTPRGMQDRCVWFHGVINTIKFLTIVKMKLVYSCKRENTLQLVLNISISNKKC